MKIALVHKKYTTKGGTERYLVNLTTGLLDAGWEVHVFVHHWDKDHDPRLIFHRLPKIPIGKTLKMLSLLYGARWSLAAEGGFDLVFGLGKTLGSDILRLGGGSHRAYLDQRLKMEESLLNKLGLRISLSSALALLIESRQLKEKRLSRIILPSKISQVQLCRHYNLSESRTVVIYNGVDLEKFPYRPERSSFLRQRYGIPEDRPIILFAATNFRLKGLGYLIRAMAEIKQAALVVVGKKGGGPYQRSANDLGLGDRIIFAGPVKDMVSYYSGSDMLVHPTFYDPFANVCLEAAATGLPVITTRANGFSEIMENGRQGFIVPDPKNTSALAEKIRILLDREQRERMGREARALAEQYPVSRNIGEVMDLVGGLLHKGRNFSCLWVH